MKPHSNLNCLHTFIILQDTSSLFLLVYNMQYKARTCNTCGSFEKKKLIRVGDNIENYSGNCHHLFFVQHLPLSQIKIPNQSLSICLQVFWSFLLCHFQRQCWKQNVSPERGNGDTWERKDRASMKAFIVVKHQTRLFVFTFPTLLVAHSSTSTALSRWMQFVNVDFCQICFCVLSPSKGRKHRWVAAAQIHTIKQCQISTFRNYWHVAHVLCSCWLYTRLFQGYFKWDMHMNNNCTRLLSCQTNYWVILFSRWNKRISLCRGHKKAPDERSGWWAVTCEEEKDWPPHPKSSSFHIMTVT